MLRLPTHGRYRYSAIETRPNYDWPKESGWPSISD